MALRWPLEGPFELLWAVVAKWLPDDAWRFDEPKTEVRVGLRFTSLANARRRVRL